MILTTCPACAAPLAHDAPRCVRCKLRYCSATCQHDHWRRGHKQMCKKIHRGGNAEFYHANKKYQEAVAVAVEAQLRYNHAHAIYMCHFLGYDEGEMFYNGSIHLLRKLDKDLVSYRCSAREMKDFLAVFGATQELLSYTQDHRLE